MYNNDMNNEKYKIFLINEEKTPVLATLVERCRNQSDFERNQIQSAWNLKVQQELFPVAADDPYLVDGFKAGGEVSALVASSQSPGSRGLDCRPKFFDGITTTWKLCDTGSMITVVRKSQDDKIDKNKKLQAVNGSSITCYGQKDIEIKIGRKSYKIKAVIADISQDIIGWDFFRKHKLSLKWGDFGDLYIYDKKANIKKALK